MPISEPEEGKPSIESHLNPETQGERNAQDRVDPTKAAAAAAEFKDPPTWIQQFGFSMERQHEIVDMILMDEDTDTTAAKPFLDRIRDVIKLYEQERPTKAQPFEGACYDSETEILTDKGWVSISSMQAGDRVLSMNPVSREAFYQEVTAVHRFPYSGELVQIDSNSSNLLVTPNHNVLVSDSHLHLEGLKFRRADQLSVNHRIPLTSVWGGCSPEYTYGFCSTDFAAFLGWYISEGWSYKSGSIGIAQSVRNSEKVLKIALLLKRMGLRYSYRVIPGQFIVSVKKVPAEMRELLKSLGKAPEKHIPRFILDYGQDCLFALFQALMAGDGCTHIDRKHLEYQPSMDYYTSSPRLADDIQELVQKLGMRGRVSVRDRIGMPVGVADGRVRSGITRFKSYEVSILHRKNSKIKPSLISHVPYTGFVYCPEVPLHHTLYVRRKGIAVWCGNSNISAGDVPIAVENMHPRLFGAVMTDPLANYRAENAPSIRNLPNVINFMNWVFKSDMGDLTDKLDEHVHSTIMFGTQTVWVRWDKMRNAYWDWEREDMEDPASPEVLKRKVDLIERGFMENLNLEDFIVPITEGRDIQRMSHCIRAYYLSFQEIMELVHRKHFLNTPTDLEAQVDELLEKEDGEELERLRTAGFTLPQVRQRKRIRMLEWHGGYDPDNEGFRSECVFTVAKSLKLYAAGRYQPFPDGKRPFEVSCLVPRKNFFYGIGVPEMIRLLALERDAIHNQRIDAGSVSIIPFGFYRAASGFKPDKITLQPGSWIPLDDIRDAHFAQFSNPSTVLAGEEAMAQSQIEKLSIAGSFQLGRESEVFKSRATARGTQIVVGQGNIRFNLLGERVKRGVAKVLTRLTVLYQRFIPPDIAERVLGDDGKQLFPKGITRKELQGRYQAYLTGDTETSNISIARQIATMVYQAMLQNPLVVRSPARVWEVSSDLLKSFGRDVKRILGEKPPDQQGFVEAVRTMIEEIKQGFAPEITENMDLMGIISGLSVFKQSTEYQDLDVNKRHLVDDAINLARQLLVQHMGRMIQQQGQGGQDQQPTFMGEQGMSSGPTSGPPPPQGQPQPSLAGFGADNPSGMGQDMGGG